MPCACALCVRVVCAYYTCASVCFACCALQRRPQWAAACKARGAQSSHHHDHHHHHHTWSSPPSAPRSSPSSSSSPPPPPPRTVLARMPAAAGRAYVRGRWTRAVCQCAVRRSQMLQHAVTLGLKARGCGRGTVATPRPSSPTLPRCACTHACKQVRLHTRLHAGPPPLLGVPGLGVASCRRCSSMMVKMAWERLDLRALVIGCSG